MQDVVVGRLLRALRRRRDWRQVDLAARASVSQSQVSMIERGHVDASSLRAVRRLFAALDARAELVVSWRGADLERLLDADHAVIVGAVARRLEVRGWRCLLEVSYSEYGERGSIDLLALDASRRACLVVEVKTSIASSEAIGRKLDEKARLAPTIVARQFGWRPDAIGRVVVLPETMRLRRLVASEETLRRMFPATMPSLRAWLRQPLGSIAGLWFFSDSGRSGVRPSARVRIRAAGTGAAPLRAGDAAGSADEQSPASSKTAGTAR